MFEDMSNESGDEAEFDDVMDEEVQQTNNSDKDQIVNPEQVEENDTLCLENLILSSSNTVKLIEKSIIRSDMDVLKDAPGVNILIFIDEDIKEIDKQCCEMMNDEEKDINLYSIIFINEVLAKDINDKFHLQVTSQTILTKDDIKNEASTILSGQD